MNGHTNPMNFLPKILSVYKKFISNIIRRYYFYFENFVKIINYIENKPDFKGNAG